MYRCRPFSYTDAAHCCFTRQTPLKALEHDLNFPRFLLLSTYEESRRFVRRLSSLSRFTWSTVVPGMAFIIQRARRSTLFVPGVWTSTYPVELRLQRLSLSKTATS